MADGELKFYLIEKEPFAFSALGGCTTFPYYSVMAMSTQMTADNIEVAIKDNDGPGGERRKEICQKIGSVFNAKPLTWSFTLETKNLFGPNRHLPMTEACVTLESNEDIGNKLRAILGKDVALELVLCQFEKVQSGRSTHLNRVKTLDMVIPPPQRGQIMCLDTTINENLRTMLGRMTINKPALIDKLEMNGVHDLILIVKDAPPVAE